MLTASQAQRRNHDNAKHSSGNRREGRLLAGGALVSVLIILAAAPVAFAQATSSTLRGVVKDPQGAVVTGATVTLTNDLRGDARQVKTGDEGSYVFTSVAPGAYTLKVETQGFKTAQQKLTIAPSETRSADVTLEIGVAADVTVVGENQPIQTETGERSETISAKQIDNLSIISRSSLELLRILPGVVAPDPGDPNSGVDRVTFGGGANATANYTVNGIRGQNNSVSIDGSRVIDIGSNNGTIITPNVDMVQEVTVKTSNFAAEYGNSGVHISATTKGGSRDFHGEVYDYIRPGRLQANDRSSSSQGLARPPTNFQYPGGNVGGPLLLPFKNFNRNRDRAFFFVGFEVQRQKPDRGARFGWVPTQAERGGDFSQSLTRVLGSNGQPLTVAQGGHLCPPDTIGWADCNGTGGAGSDGGARSPVPNGNFVPYRNALGAALLNFYPLPNFTPPAGSAYAALHNNYASNFVSPENRTDLKMRFDYKVTDRTNAYLRLARESESDDSPYGIWWGPSAFELPSHVVGTNLGRSAAINITSVLNPTMTNEIVLSGSKLKLDYDYNDPAKVSKSALGVQNIQLPFTGANAQTPYASVALINGWANGAGNMWEPGGLPLFAINDSYSVTDTLSKVYKNHTLKFGGLVERASKVQNLNSVVEGRFEFERDQARTTGNAFANLYTGRINDFQQSTNVPTGHFRFWNLEGYGQDSWKLRPNVTVEFGARLSLFTNNTEQTGLAAVFDPSAYVRGAGAFLPGANGQPDINRPNGFLTFRNGQIPKSIYDSNPGLKVAPRLNIAWDISGKGTTVIRGGAGMFYNRVQGNYQYAMQTIAPNLITVGNSSWGAPNNDLTLGNLASFNPFNTTSPTCRCVAGGVSPDRNSNEIPQIITTSLSVARRLPFKNVLEVGYVGTFGRHLPQRTGLNFILNPLTSGTFGNANLADPVQRAAIAARGTNAGDSITAPVFANLLPFPVFSAANGGGIQLEEYIGTSNYHSVQVTLNRQLGKKLQYFLTYTFSKALGTTSVNESDGDAIIDPIDTRGRSYGILPFDRTHIFNLSYNYNFPDLARGALDSKFTRGLLNGWQMSGITTFQSGHPIRVKFTGDINSQTAIFANFGYYAVVGSNALSSSGVAPLVLRNATTGSSNINDLFIDPAAFAIPPVGTSGPYQSPFYLRSPRTSNFDMTFFKNFNFSESKKLQFRAGFFNIFNQAFANPDTTPSDIGNYSGGSLTLNTLYALNPATGTCFRIPAGTPNGVGVTAGGSDAPCDPTKGFRIDPTSAATFGQIINKHGHRRLELALKFYF